MKEFKTYEGLHKEVNELAYKEFENNRFEMEENNGRYFGILKLTGGLGNLTLSCPSKDFFKGFTIYHNGNVVFKGALITVTDVKLLVRQILKAI